MKGFREIWAARSFTQKSPIIAASAAAGFPFAASIDLSLFDRVYAMATAGFVGWGVAQVILAIRDIRR